MGLQPPRWTEVSASEHAHEREGLRTVQDILPNADPYRAWTNFEFIAEDGSINEVDLLVLTPTGVFVVELKHWSGDLSGDAGTWHRRRRGSDRTTSVDNPILLTNRKAKKLASLLDTPYKEMRKRTPFLTAKVFLSNPNLDCRLTRNARQNVHTTADIEAALTRVPADFDRRRLTAEDARRLTRALERIGVRPSPRKRTVGDYEIGAPVGAGPGYQDFDATHTALGTRHRVRIYGFAPGTGADTDRQRDLAAQAARREYRLLQGVSHEGILAARQYVESDRGPALVFDDDDQIQRLDHFLNERRDELTFADRLDLVRSLAEALRYAHGKGITHRALSPTAVVIRDVDSPGRHLQVANWQTGHRDLAGLTASGTRLTAHFGDLVDETTKAYTAPDILAVPDPDWIAADVFGLGATAFTILSGEAPAASFNGLLKVLRDDDGLRLSAAVDGVNGYVEELILSATRPRVTDRTGTVAEFLDDLDVAELDLAPAEATPDDDSVADPTSASPGDRLEGGYLVRRCLGTGSTSVVYLVKAPDGDEVVLKVADDARHNERLRDEGEVLAKLRHTDIVRHIATTEIGGLTTLVLASAGDETLRQRLRSDGPQHLDYLARFGEQLLDALRYLEHEGVAHRDVKPDNLGVVAHSHTHEMHLVLFDFSLARAPLDEVRVGTPGYLDPFVAARGRWDLYAERYAAAATLHEMAAGTRPRWGDDRSDASLTDDELVLDVDLFPSEVRDGLAGFLRRGLARDVAERFGNADEMLRAWRRVFETIDAPVLPVDGGASAEAPGDALAAACATAAVTDPLLTLPFSTRAQNAFGRLGVETVHDLLATPLSHVSHMRGVGQKTRREIVDAVKVLAPRFPDVERAAPAPVPAEAAATDDATPAEGWSFEVLGAALVPAAVRKGSREPDVVRAYLDGWPSQTDVADASGVTRARVSQVAAKARERWRRLRGMTDLRETVAAIVARLGGIATPDEVADEVAAIAGAVDDDRAQTTAVALVRAATEVEVENEAPRWTFGRMPAGAVLVATETAALDYAAALGRAADALAARDPLPGAQRIVAELGDVAAPAGVEPIAPARLVRVAAAASRSAATAANRMELYPRGIEPDRAVRLAAPALLGARALTPEEVRERVAARYPDAAPLPDRPELDALLDAAGIGMRWDDADARYRAAAMSFSGVTTWQSQRSVFSHTPRHPADRADPAVRDFDARLAAAHADGGFVALVTAPRRIAAAEAALAATFPEMRSISVEASLLAHMHDAATAAGAKWDAFVGADAAGPAGSNWAKLTGLVKRALPAVEADLAADPDTLVLLRRPGLLVRYDCLDVLERIRDRCGRSGPDGIFARWLLVAAGEGTEAPMIDAKPLPVLTSTQWARIPSAWVAAHTPEPAATAGGEVA